MPEGILVAQGPSVSVSAEAANAIAMTMLPIIEICRHSPGMITAMGVSMGLTSAAIMSKGTIAQKERWALDLLGAVLGDGMGSRLFLDLRERRSLVYDVSTFSAMYADTGTFGIHAGFDPEDAERWRADLASLAEQLSTRHKDAFFRTPREEFESGVRRLHDRIPLLALATYGVGFAARPLGGIIFGHFGDRIGRKATLVAARVAQLRTQLERSKIDGDRDSMQERMARLTGTVTPGRP